MRIAQNQAISLQPQLEVTMVNQSRFVCSQDKRVLNSEFMTQCKTNYNRLVRRSGAFEVLSTMPILEYSRCYQL
jgi:hypothetical protein